MKFHKCKKCDFRTKWIGKMIFHLVFAHDMCSKCIDKLIVSVNWGTCAIVNPDVSNEKFPELNKIINLVKNKGLVRIMKCAICESNKVEKKTDNKEVWYYCLNCKADVPVISQNEVLK